MVSTISVSDEIRRKIKKLATYLDTTQNKIVEKAIELLEKEILTKSRKVTTNKKIKKILEDARLKIEKEDPEWAKISKIIKKASTDIDEFRSERWGDEL